MAPPPSGRHAAERVVAAVLVGAGDQWRGRGGDRGAETGEARGGCGRSRWMWWMRWAGGRGRSQLPQNRRGLEERPATLALLVP